MAGAGKPKSDLKRSRPRRLGDDSQDVIALDVLIDWLEHSDQFPWVRVEADDFSALDDVTALLAIGTLRVWQVMCSTYPETQEDWLTWDTLLKQEPGQTGPKPSLMQN
jgi:hypothetical protein